MKNFLLLSIGVVILILAVTGRIGVFGMAVTNPENVKDVS